MASVTSCVSRPRPSSPVASQSGGSYRLNQKHPNSFQPLPRPQWPLQPRQPLGVSPRPSSPCRPGPAFRSDAGGSSGIMTTSRETIKSGGRREKSSTAEREASVKGDPSPEGPPSLAPSLLLPADCLSVQSLGEDSELLERLGLTLNGGMKGAASANRIAAAAAGIAAAGPVDHTGVAGVRNGHGTNLSAEFPMEAQRREMQSKLRLLASRVGQMRMKEELTGQRAEVIRETLFQPENQEVVSKEEEKDKIAPLSPHQPLVEGQARETPRDGALLDGSAIGTGSPQQPQHGFKIIKEELKFSRFLKVYNRVVQHPSRPLEQDHFPNAATGAAYSEARGVAGARGPIVAACAASPILGSSEAKIMSERKQQQEEELEGKQFEYDIVSSACDHFICVLPYHSATKSVTLLREYAQGANGLLYTVPCGGFSSSHASLEDCVRSELSEEARLRGGRLVKLIPDDHPGLLEVKWCRNRFTPFLIIDPETDLDPMPRDPEEFIQVMQLPVGELTRVALGGDMMLPSIVTCTMGLQYLRDHQLL